MPTDYPEVTSHGLVLWRLCREPDQQLLCRVTEHANDLFLAVTSLSGNGDPLGEAHPDVRSVIERADAIRTACLANGWDEVDPETSTLRNEP